MNVMNKSNSLLSISMGHLGTSKRINSAADDAAGLQIATRLQAQSNGMGVAMRNISDATAMLQTAEGAFDEVTNILHRMKDLSTQAANGTNSAKDLTAMQSEFKALGSELDKIMSNTRYSGEDLFGTTKLGEKTTFQVGAGSSEKMEVDVVSALDDLKTELKNFGTGDISPLVTLIP